MLTKKKFFKNLKLSKKELIKDEEDRLNSLPDEISSDILINILCLEEIPTDEDGFFREFLNTKTGIESQTEIFYLLKTNQISCLHRLSTTETWTWLGGVEISFFVFKNSKLEKIILNEKNFTYTVEEGLLFGAKLNNQNDNNDFSLVTCLCKPGFIPEHYSNPTLEELNNLKEKNPEYKSVIDELTPKKLKSINNINTATSFDESKYNNSKNNFIRSAFLFCAQCIGIKKNEEQTPLINSPQNNR